MPIIEPFVRWAGGKTWFISTMQNLIRNVEINHYHEPFLGGAAVFFSLDLNKKAYLSDVNEELINTFLQIRDNPYEVIGVLSKFNNTEEEYYKIRSMVSENKIEKAAQFIFLNQTSYNGIYRVNKNGVYNVPYGFRDNWNYDFSRIIRASSKLKNTQINCEDFETHKSRVQQNDLVFLDPPYTVSHNNNGFIEYNKNLFSLDDQYRLSKYIDYIKKRGAYYILTNAAHERIRQIFEKDDRIIEVSRNSLIGGKNAKREKISELIFTNLPEDKNEFTN